LVVGPLLRPRWRQPRGQYQNQQCNQTFHIDTIAIRNGVWQRCWRGGESGSCLGVPLNSCVAADQSEPG
jgi:hypothetical protein